MTRRATGLFVPLIALIAVLASGTWLVTQERGSGFFATGLGDRGGVGGPMMGGAGSGWLAGDGSPVDDLVDARDRAEKFAVTLSPELRVGEVMRFAENYYAELEEPDGAKATEVLIDPRTGAVQLEVGPARMWNTRFGMLDRSGSGGQMTAAKASAVAERWVENREGLTVGEPDAFPGYYTLHTLRDGQVDGMLSVNAVTGQVWYHSWHGEFEEMSEGK